jgi:hypothetical protein
MTISLPVPVLTGDVLSTYDGLIEAIPAWLQDNSITARLPEMIYLAEDDFRTRIFHPYREGVATLTGAETIALPLDFVSPVGIWVTTTPIQKLLPMPPGGWELASSGRPRFYEIVGEELWISPTPSDTFTVKLQYNRKLTPLTEANQSNWLLEQFPAAYFYGVLLQAEFFGWNDERVPLIKAALDEKIDGINREGNRRRFATPIRMRASSYA